MLPSFRERVETLKLPPERRGQEPELGPDDQPATWVVALRPVFESRYAPLLRPLVLEMTEVGRGAAALPLTRATRTMIPDDVEIGLFAMRAGILAGDESAARAEAERAIRNAPLGHPVRDGLRFEYATLLERLGEPALAHALLDTLQRSDDARVAQSARERLAGR